MADQNYLYVTGRIVSGNPFEKQPDSKDPRTGVVQEGGWFVGIAVPKNDPAGNQVREAVMAAAKVAWPKGEWGYPTFSSKIKDGDLPPQNSKEGYPGHWVFGFSQSWPFQVYSQGGTSQIVDPKAVKKGDYARVPFTCKGNNADVHKNQTPGMYLNAALVEFLGYGPAILSGPDPKTVMAAIGAAVMPAGASATPVVGTTPPLTPAATPPPVPGIVPAPDFLKPPVMTAKAAGVSFAAFEAEGWTKELLIAHGYMEA